MSDQFTETNEKKYKIQIGRTIAASLSGFVAGVIAGAIAVGVVVYLIFAQKLALEKIKPEVTEVKLPSIIEEVEPEALEMPIVPTP